MWNKLENQTVTCMNFGSCDIERSSWQKIIPYREKLYNSQWNECLEHEAYHNFIDEEKAKLLLMFRNDKGSNKIYIIA